MAVSEATGQLPAPDQAPGRGGMLKFIAAVLLLTVIAVGMGGLLGMQLAAAVTSAVKQKAAGEKAIPVDSRYTGSVHLRKLEPIITNISEPKDIWVRLEASLVLDEETTPDADRLAGEITEDLLAYLRTVSLGHIEGPSGFQHLRDDLEERVAIRSGGRVRELVVQTLVVQ